MIYSYNGLVYSNKKNQLLLHITGINLTGNNEKKELVIKEYMQYDSIYVKFKSRILYGDRHDNSGCFWGRVLLG